MSHHYLKHFMPQAHSLSHTNITTNTGTEDKGKDATPSGSKGPHTLAVSQKQVPQPVTLLILITTSALS